MLRRLDSLPRELLSGTWTACAVTVEAGRIHLGELPEQTDLRRRLRLRRRGRWLLGALLSLPAAALAGTPAVTASMLVVGLFCLLAGLDGLRRDLRGAEPRHEFIVLDPARAEIELRGPAGALLFAPLSDVRMFLVVADQVDGRCHLAVVSQSGGFLPWLSTPSVSAASSLTWLLGHLCDRPARRLEAPIDEAFERLEQAVPIAGPEPPTA